MSSYEVKQYFSSFSSCTDEERENPKECTVNNLNDIKDIDWVKVHTLKEKFFKLSVSPFVTINKIEKFYLMAEEKEGLRWSIVANVTCSKEEALQVFPEFVRNGEPNYVSDIIAKEAKILENEVKEIKTIEDITHKYLSFIGKQ